MPVAIGTRLGPYEITALLGAGGMGEVYKARDTRLERDVAIKFLPDRLIGEKAALERFVREARAASALNHPNIVTIYEIGEAENGRFMVMEFVHGRTLRVLLREQLAFDAIPELVAQIGRALAVAHAAGIVHRDIKPENVMVRDDGYVKVLDFGLARLLPSTLGDPAADTTAATAPGVLLGTVRYMAPEQARGGTADAAADVFSLGIVVYELTTGYHPFLADSPISILHAILSRAPLAPSRLNPEISVNLEALILQMLEKNPLLRPSAQEVVSRLAAHEEPKNPSKAAPVATARRHLVGRDRERSELNAAFRSATSERGLLLCISGEAGLGKTTLVEEFITDLVIRDMPCNIARGRCSERLAGTEAYLPFLEALDSLVHAEDRDNAVQLMKLLAPSWYLELAPLSAEASSTMRLLAESKAGSQERMKRELAAFLQEMAALTPLVLFLEDLHWADASTIDLLAYVANRFEAAKLLVVATFRPSELARGHHPFVPVKLELQAHGLCREIPLGFLAPVDVEKYLALEFPDHEFPAALPLMIHARTEGNPLFMADLLRYLKARRTIDQERGRWTLTGAVGEVERQLPESVRSMIQRKIDALGEDDRRLLIAGSVQGYEFDSAVVTRALGLDPVLVEERLDALERLHALVRCVAERELPDRTLSLRYRFVHVLYQNALYASLRATRKASLSTAIANAIIELYQDQTAGVASELALLLETGRDFSRSAGYFFNAAQHAAKIFANQEAVVLARRGLDLLKSLPESPERGALELKLHIALGGPLTALKGFAANEVQQAYVRARELCGQIGDTPQLFPVLHGLFRFYIVRGDIRTARQITEQLLTLAESVNDSALLIEAHRALGATLFCTGEFQLAREHLEKGLEFYDPERHRTHTGVYGADPGTVCLSWLAFALWILGYPEQARQASERAVTLAREHPHPANLAYALALASWFHQYRRDTAAVNAHADAAIAISQEHGLPLWLAIASAFRGWALMAEGQHDYAIAQLSDGTEKFKATGAELNLPHFYGMLAQVYGKARRFDEAFGAIEEALAVANRNMDRCYEAELYRLEGDLLVEQGQNGREAEESLLQAVDVARKQGARTFELRALTSLARALARQGRRAEALQLLTPALKSLPELHGTPDLKDAEAVLEQVIEVGPAVSRPSEPDLG